MAATTAAGTTTARFREHRSKAVIPLRWIAVSIMMLAASLNYLDRQLLSSFAPSIKTEFGLSNVQYGQIIGAFALTYAICAPLMGVMIDFLGLRMGTVCAVSCWSIFSAVTGLARSFPALFGVRVGLAFGESALLPAISKGGALYLDPAELAVSSGFGAMAITLGVSSAPLLAAFLGPRLGWRGLFLLTGLFGVGWVTIWLRVSGRTPPRQAALKTGRIPYSQLFRDARLWGASAAWALALLNFAVWSGWMTIFLVQTYHMSEVEANRKFAWLPPLFSILGGFAGGIFVFRSIRRGKDPLQSRVTNSLWMALLLPATILAPWMPTPELAVAMIGVSYIGSFAISGNANVMPIDIFGAHHAGVASALAAGLYAIFQSALGPLMGLAIDNVGFKWSFAGLGLLSLAGVLILRLTNPRTYGQNSPLKMRAV